MSELWDLLISEVSAPDCSRRRLAASKILDQSDCSPAIIKALRQLADVEQDSETREFLATFLRRVQGQFSAPNQAGKKAMEGTVPEVPWNLPAATRAAIAANFPRSSGVWENPTVLEWIQREQEPNILWHLVRRLPARPESLASHDPVS